MILIDFTQTIIAGLMAQLKITDGEISEDMLRHMILNSVRNYQKRYSEEYGEIVLCTDAANPWRREYFPLYKANRKKSREKDDKDWGLIFDTLHKVKMEIKENFPYRYMYVEGCEADDIIAILTQHHYILEQDKPLLIVSGDKDFQQLHNDDVEQWSPNLNKMINCPEPEMFLNFTFASAFKKMIATEQKLSNMHQLQIYLGIKKSVKSKKALNIKTQ